MSGNPRISGFVALQATLSVPKTYVYLIPFSLLSRHGTPERCTRFVALQEIAARIKDAAVAGDKERLDRACRQPPNQNIILFGSLGWSGPETIPSTPSPRMLHAHQNVALVSTGQLGLARGSARVIAP
jgi:hypothetical protein